METISHFGQFTENGRCFEAHRTPHRRWMNVHHNDYCDGTNGSPEFFAQISQYGDGPIHFRRPEGHPVSLVNWESSGLYVRDDQTGRAFSPAGAPLTTPVADLRVRYRPESTEISSVCDGIAATQRIFVPRRQPVQVWTITLENRSPEPRTLSVFAAVRFDLGGNPCVDVHPELGGVFAWQYDSTRDDPYRRGFFCVTSHFAAATAHREDFFSPALNFSAPRLLDGHDLGNISTTGFDSMGAVQAKISLAPGASQRLDFLLGHAPTPEAAIALRQDMTSARIDELLAEVADLEKRDEAAYSVETGHPNLDTLINHFVKKQHRAYLTNKSGFRDNVQVCFALDMADEQLAETALLRALSHQYAAGWAPHGFRPLGTKQCSDEPAWILQAVPWHIQQTGDLDFAWKKIPFIDDPTPATVWEHVLRATRWLAKDTRSHGLCDLRSGDWNDGLSPRGENSGRESVMVTEQLCFGLLEVAGLADRLGETAVAAEFRTLHAEFARRLNEHAWDGEWYRRILCEDGTFIGSAQNEEGKIFMNAQSWAVLGRIASPERAALCMDSVERLIKLDIGYRIVWPPFTKFDPRVGGSTTVFPGMIENGGCYNHAAGFKGVADCLLGRAEQAWETFRKVAPDNPENPVTRSHAEPFAFSNLFMAERYRYARSLYAWNTGTGAWFAILLVEYILGVRRSYDGLLIAPCLTAEIPKARVIRKFRGATFDIRLDNTAGRRTGLRSLTCDGVPVEGNILPDFREGTHIVEAVI
jgi:cellobiose phosphorylase